MQSDFPAFFADHFCCGSAMQQGRKQIFMHYYLTWGEFALILAAALLIYYLIILLGYYQKELLVFFNRQRGAGASKGIAVDNSVMGIVNEDDAEMNLVDSDELYFVAPEEEEEVAPAYSDKNKTLLLGGLADFMQELKTLIRITVEAEDTKENFLSLFSLIASKYSQLMDGSFDQAIISYVLDSGLHNKISPEELEQILNDLNNEE